VSIVAHRPAVARLLDASLSQHDGGMASVPESVDLGRVCGIDLCERIGVVLVRGLDPRSCDFAASREEAIGEDHLRNVGDGLEGLGSTLASLRDYLCVVGCAGNAAGYFS